MKPCNVLATLLLATVPLPALAQGRPQTTTLRVPSKATPVDVPLKNAGTYHIASGTWTRARAASRSQSSVLYCNRAPSGYAFDSTLTSWAVIDAGRIPSTSSPAPNTGTANAYVIDAFEVAYCTGHVSANTSFTWVFLDRYGPCSDIDNGGNPAIAVRGFLASGILPGSSVSGARSCWIVSFDLSNTSLEFAFAGDGDGTWDNDPASDSFGFATIVNNNSLGLDGPVLAGNCPPQNPAPGEGTVFNSPGVADCTGLGTTDRFWIDGLATTTNPNGGCFFFGGCPGNPYSSFYLTLLGDAGVVPQSVTFNGTRHDPIGQADLDVSSGSLRVSNLGSSGQDGVRVSLGEASGFGMTMPLPASFPDGASVTSRSFGQVAGAPADLGGLTWRRVGNSYEVTPDFGILGPISYTVIGFEDGHEVARAVGLSGALEVMPMPSGGDEILLQACYYKGWAWPSGIFDDLKICLPGGAVNVTDFTIRPDMRNLPDAVGESVEITADGLSQFTIESELLGAFDQMHQVRGAALLDASSGGQSLVVSNLGSSGQDGVRVFLEDAREFELELVPLDLTTNGAIYTAEAFGLKLCDTGSIPVPDGQGSPVGSAGCTNTGVVRASADFSDIGATMVRVELYLNGVLQDSGIRPNGALATVTAGPSGAPRIRSTDFYSNPARWVLELAPTGRLQIDGRPMPVETDEVRLIAHDPSDGIGQLTHFDLGLGVAGDLSITDEVAPAADIGSRYCETNPNSSGEAASIWAIGSLDPAREDLTLIAVDCPANAPGLFFLGSGQIQSGFGDGIRCVGGSTARVAPVGFSDANGTACQQLDFSQPYASGIVTGASLNFQYWFRDGMAMMAGFNLSDAVHIEFQ